MLNIKVGKMGKNTLISLTNDTLQILDRIYELEQSGEDVPAELEEALSEALTSQAEKIDRCSRFVSFCKHQQNFLKEQKKKIEAEIKRLETHQEKIKFLAKRVMDMEETNQLRGMEGSLFYLSKSKSCNVIDENLLPEEFITWEKKIDKRSLLEALKEGREVSGAKIEEKTNVVVK